MIDKGLGRTLILIPGIQGRCEWMGPAIRALAQSYRVLSFSLGEAPRPRRSAGPGDSAADDWLSGCVRLIDGLVGRGEDPRVALVGVSFGGLVAAAYAAERPANTCALVLASTPPPRWRLDERLAAYARRPVRSAPAFAWLTWVRFQPELRAALPGRWARAAFMASYFGRGIRFPASPRRMAEWVETWQTHDLTPWLARIAAPTLVLTGEPGLDLVVPPERSLEYLSLIPHARSQVFHDTGHVGLVSKPEEFAKIVGGFIASSCDSH